MSVPAFDSPIRDNLPRGWPPETTDIENARDGDVDALERILISTYPKLAGYFLARGCTRDDASDLASETMMRIAVHVSNLMEPRAYRTWVWKLTESIFRDWIRLKQRTRRLRWWPSDTTVPGPDDWYEVQEEERRLGDAFRQLNRKDQQILWLRYVEELSYADIAQIRKNTENAVRVQTHRAKRRLENRFNRTP